MMLGALLEESLKVVDSTCAINRAVDCVGVTTHLGLMGGKQVMIKFSLFSFPISLVVREKCFAKLVIKLLYMSCRTTALKIYVFFPLFFYSLLCIFNLVFVVMFQLFKGCLI